ncbi:MAG TPA: BrnT family toxin [Tardiphaga sp.]
MRIVWDESKRLINIARHEMDFVDLDEAFFQTSFVRPAKNGRLIAVGRLMNGIVAAIFVTLGTEGISVISMRPASRKERRLIDG